MKIKLSDWASIAEVLSGIAVVITLIVLVVGIRENTRVTRAAVFESNMNGLYEFRSHIINNPDIADAYEVYRRGDYESLEGTLRARTRQLIWLQFGIYENAFYSERYGVLGDDEWARFKGQACNFFPEIEASAELRELAVNVFTPAFLDFVEGGCE